jgi:hypothetical protein
VVIDYEAAWHELAAFVASKTQHGREQTLVEMTRIAQEHRVPAGELSRLLRLYSIEVERTRTTSQPDGDEAPYFAGGQGSPADDVLPRHHDRGGHDGRNGSSAGDGRDAGGGRIPTRA